MESQSHKLYGGKYYAHSKKRGLMRKLGQLSYCHLIKRQKDTRILVILHLFYMDAWKEIREYLKNLSPYNYYLIMTCMNGFYDEDTLISVQAFKPDTKIIKCENLGWDVLPFLTALHSVDLSDYDIVFKLQSKGTKRPEIYLYGQYFRYRNWFQNLFEGCIGPFTVHTVIRDLLDEKKNVGLVAARNLIVEDPIHKQHMVEETLDELNLLRPDNYKFIAGTCFAIRANLLSTIQNLQIVKERFNQNGFSFAHRMERIMCFPPLWNGLKIEGKRVMSFRRSLWVFFPFAWWWRKYNGARVLKDPHVNVDDIFAFNCIEPRLIESFNFVDIKVGDIKRELYPSKKVIVSIDETLPYKYLLSRDPAIYEEYCKYNHEVWHTDIMSQERFDKLIASMDRNGDTKDKNIVIDDQNIIWDGQHRCCWLYYSKGAEHLIKVLQLKRYYPKQPFFLRVYNSLKYRIPLAVKYAHRYFYLKK